MKGDVDFNDNNLLSLKYFPNTYFSSLNNPNIDIYNIKFPFVKKYVSEYTCHFTNKEIDIIDKKFPKFGISKNIIKDYIIINYFLCINKYEDDYYSISYNDPNFEEEYIDQFSSLLVYLSKVYKLYYF